MSRRVRRHATEAAGEGAYPSLVNQGYVSDYFLAYRLESGFEELYKRWSAAEQAGHATPRTRLRSVGGLLAKHRSEAARTAPDDVEGIEGALNLAALDQDAVAAHRALCDGVAGSLGWTPEAETLELLSGGSVLRVPASHVRRTPSGLLLVVLPTVFGSDPAGLVASKRAAAGTLLDPIISGEKPVARTLLEAAQALFTADSCTRTRASVGRSFGSLNCAMSHSVWLSCLET